MHKCTLQRSGKSPGAQEESKADHFNTLTLAVALTAARSANHTCLHRGDPLIWVLLPVELFDLCRLEENQRAAAAAVLAPAAHPPVLAEAAAAAVLAEPAFPPACSHLPPPPPQSLHWVRTRPCSQMPLPPQSLHSVRRRPCSQRPLPPQSLQLLRTRPCSQMLPPPQSLHLLRRRPCSQMLLPPHSLQFLRCRPCSHFFSTISTCGRFPSARCLGEIDKDLWKKKYTAAFQSSAVFVKRCVGRQEALFLRLRSARGLPTTRACTVRTPSFPFRQSCAVLGVASPAEAWAEGHPGRGTPRRRGTRSAGRGLRLARRVGR